MMDVCREAACDIKSARPAAFHGTRSGGIVLALRRRGQRQMFGCDLTSAARGDERDTSVLRTGHEAGVISNCLLGHDNELLQWSLKSPEWDPVDPL